MTKAEENLIRACMSFLDKSMWDVEAVSKVRRATAVVAAERIQPEQLELLKSAFMRSCNASMALDEASKSSGIPTALIAGVDGLYARWNDEFRGRDK